MKQKLSSSNAFYTFLSIIIGFVVGAVLLLIIGISPAEAYAKLNEGGKALADVNTIRRRAGIPEMNNYAAFGYNSVLDVVLDERRMELCFEGHRYFDVFRNKLAMDRRYVGYHTWEIIQPDDLRLAMLISQDEINSAGIEQNPR